MIAWNSFPGNKSCCKAATNCQRQYNWPLFQLLLKKASPKAVYRRKWICRSLRWMSHARILCQDYPGIVLVFICRVLSFNNTVDGRDLVRDLLGRREAKVGIWSKDGRIKPLDYSGCAKDGICFWSKHKTIQWPTKGVWTHSLIEMGLQRWMIHFCLVEERNVLTILSHIHTQTWPESNFLTRWL